MWPVPCGSLATSRTALKTRLMWKTLSRGAKWDNLPSELSFMGILESIMTVSRK